MSASLSGGKDSVKPESHLKHITDDVGSMKSWPSDCHMGQKEGRIVLYVLGTTTTDFWKIWENLYKPYKAAAGADAKTFSSWYKERLLETFSPEGEVTALRGKVESAIKLVEEAKPVVVSLETKLGELEKFEAIVAAELAAIKARTMKSRSQHNWAQDAKAHLVPTTLVNKKVPGRYVKEGFAASAEVAARAWRVELKKQQAAVGTEGAAEDAAYDAAGDAFYAIVKALKNHELDACRALDAKQLEDRLWPRAKALAAHYSAVKKKAGRASAASPNHNMAAALKTLQASRLGREYCAAGYVPHNNNKQTQAARRAEGIYDGADLFAALTGIGQ